MTKEQSKIPLFRVSTDPMTLIAVFVLGAAIAILCFTTYTYITGIILFLGVIAFIHLLLVAADHLDP